MEEKLERSIRHVPMIKFYQTRYGKSLQGNDQKAARVFKEFESEEKVRRLRNELMWVKESRVNERVLSEVLGRKKVSQRGSFEKWAELMLIWLSKSL
jgi:hypothetical protein